MGLFTIVMLVGSTGNAAWSSKDWWSRIVNNGAGWASGYLTTAFNGTPLADEARWPVIDNIKKDIVVAMTNNAKVNAEVFRNAINSAAPGTLGSKLTSVQKANLLNYVNEMYRQTPTKYR